MAGVRRGRGRPRGKRSAKKKKKRKTFSPVLDVHTENIIYLLSLDSRRTVADLAKELRLSWGRVAGRVKKLVNNGIVRFVAVSNPPEQCRMTFLIKLRSKKEQTLERLRSIPSCTILRSTLGMYNILMMCRLPSATEREALMQEIGRALGMRGVRFEELQHDWIGSLGYKAFCHRKSLLREDVSLRPSRRRLSQAKESILEALHEDALMSYTKIAERTGLNRNLVKDSIAQLRSAKVLSFTLYLDYRKLGLEYHHMLLKVHPARRKRFEKYAMHHPRIHFLKSSPYSGWDYVLSIATQDIPELIRVTDEILEANENTILDDTTLISNLDYTPLLDGSCR